MATLGLLLLPGHVDKRSLQVVVDDLHPAAGPLLDLLLVRGIALDTESDLLQTSILQHLLGHLAVFDILEKAVHGRTRHRLAVLFAHLRRILFVPVHDVI